MEKRSVTDKIEIRKMRTIRGKFDGKSSIRKNTINIVIGINKIIACIIYPKIILK